METNLLRAFGEMWARTLDFSGRTRRASYWGAMLLCLVISFILGMVWAYADLIFSLFACVPTVAMSVRRLHDTGRRGFWLLLALVPLGGIVVLVMLLMDSEGANRYGPSPKYGNVPF
nr:DUF805 domain-containing protein [uncultured Butyricicoccus sp.]